MSLTQPEWMNLDPLVDRESHSRSYRSGAMNALTVPRIFSKPGVHPYGEIEWVKTEAKITDDGGKVIFSPERIEAPKSWSPLAVKIAVSKYFYSDAGKGSDPRTGRRRRSPRSMRRSMGVGG